MRYGLKIFLFSFILPILIFSMFIPIKDNYSIKREDDKTGKMYIRYSPIIRFYSIDTVVNSSRPFLAEIVLHEKKTVNGLTRYNTIVRIGDEIYQYSTRDAYEYVKQFSDSTGHYKLEEVFWPRHYFRTYKYDIIEL